MTEGVWNWATGPEAGTNFWNGGAAGSAAINPVTGIPMYSNWLGGSEPNNSGNNEHYAHIKKNASTWNDLKNAGDGPTSTDYRAEGYIIEYGGTDTDPILQISASTSIYVPKVLTISTDIEVCAGTSVNLTATVTEGSVFWYDSLSGGSLVGTGNTYTTPVLNSSKTYYATASPEGCSTSDKLAVVVSVYAVPVAIKPDNIERCEDDGNGFNTFDFDTNITPKILSGQAATDFEVLYFNNLSDANRNIAGTSITSPYSLPAGNTQTIYTRVHNKNNTSCFALTSFTIAVTGFPVPETPTNYPFCDNNSVGSDTDGFVYDFILENKDAQILGSLDPNQYTVSYHTTQNGAQTNTTLDAITKTINYTNTTANTQPVYVRVENVDNAACFDASKSFNLIVNQLPIISSTAELKQCDDDTDGFSLFNLNEAASNISTNYLNETFVFYPSPQDAKNGTDAFTAAEAMAFRNRFVTTDIVWARAISGFGCYRIAEVNLVVSTTGLPATFQRSFTLCDDFLDRVGNNTVDNDDTDGVSAFDFSSVTAEVRALFPISQQLTITYYRNQADALAEVDPITNTANYRNIDYPNTQQIYIRVDSNLDNDCLGFGPFINLTVDPVPTADPVTNLILCDNGDDGNFTNGIVQTFNLETQTPIILGAQDPLNFTVTYHTSDLDALSGNNPVTDTTMYKNTIANLQTVYVKVANNITGCFTNHTSFDLIVNELPIANLVHDLEVCDDNTDGSAQNGFSQTFDLQLQTDGILGTQEPTQFSVTYHASLTDAQEGILPLGSPFSNSEAFSQIIYARVYNSLTGCANGISNFNAIVNPGPTFEAISNLSKCDNNDDGDAANQIIQTIDLDGKITEILGASQDADDYNVSFHSSKAAASSGNAPIASPYTNTSSIETIYVRIQSRATSCVNDDATFDILVNSLPDFTVTSPQIVCLNDTPKNISIENPLEIYSYVWRDVDGNTIGIDDNLDVTNGGNYTVTGTTTNGTNCSRTETIIVSESKSAILLNSFVTIVDEGNNIGNENNLSILIDVINNDLGPGDYQFSLRNDDENTTTLFQDEPLFENLEGGIFIIIVNDKNGCVPNTTLQISVLQFPKFFTPNGDNKNDTWIIKGANKTFYPNSSVNIFNRYGKLIAQIPIDKQGWNGTYNGKKLSSADYWYNITLIPADVTKQTINKTGNFSLIRK